MKLVTFHTYRGQVGKDTTQSRRTFTTRLEVMPESTSYLQELSVQASSCPVTPSSLSLSWPKPNEEVEPGGRAEAKPMAVSAGGLSARDSGCSPDSCSPRRPLPAAPAGRAAEGRREGKELAPAAQGASHPPHLREAGSRGGQGAGRQLREHARPRGTGETRGAHQHGRSYGDRADTERRDSGSLLARPDKEAPNPAREGGKRGARGENRSDPCPPPRPTGFTWARLRWRKGNAAAAAAALLTARVRRPPATAPPAAPRPPLAHRLRWAAPWGGAAPPPPMVPPLLKIDGHPDQSEWPGVRRLRKPLSR